MFKHVTSRAGRQFLSASQTSRIARRHAATATFDWKDPLGSNNLFTEEEQAIAETAEAYCQEQMLPRVLGEVHCTRIGFVRVH